MNGCNNLTIFNHTSVATGDDALGLFDIACRANHSCAPSAQLTSTPMGGAKSNAY